MEPKKITVGKTEEVTEVAEKIIDAEASGILLVIPKFSRLAESAANFRLLKREADALGKQLMVESVDEKVVKLAGSHGIECRNPFFEAGGERRFSDISGNAPKSRGRNDSSSKEDTVEPVAAIHRFVEASHSTRKRRLLFRPRFWLIGVGGAALIALGFYIALGVLPKADITLIVKTVPWSYDTTVLADKAVSVPDTKLMKIPGQVFQEKKNLQLQFPASGQKRVERKATGKIIIYNNYSSAPQSLVARTRFSAPDGKIFRLTEAVLVPGAKIEGGKLTQSSIEAQVTADVSGESYNIGPVARFTIPGFAGSPKSAGFSGESKEPMAGGFIGQAPFPTTDDIVKAKDTAGKTLENSMRTLVEARLPKEFKLIQGAEQFALGKSDVVTEVDADGRFTLSEEGTITLTVFREQDLLTILSEKAKEQNAAFEIRQGDLTYGKPELKPGDLLSVPIHYQAKLVRKIDVEEVKRTVAKKGEAELRAAVFALSSVESAHISLWPFWVRSVPADAERIKVTIDYQ